VLDGEEDQLDLGLACRVMLFELNRWQVPDRGVQPIGVVAVGRACDPPFDVSSVGPGGPVRLIASVLNRLMVDSHNALSSASPTVPIEPAIPSHALTRRWLQQMSHRHRRAMAIVCQNEMPFHNKLSRRMRRVSTNYPAGSYFVEAQTPAGEPKRDLDVV
jgi:hypothetical protein